MQYLLKLAQWIWHCLAEWCGLSSICKSYYKIVFLLAFVIVVPSYGGKNVL